MPLPPRHRRRQTLAAAALVIAALGGAAPAAHAATPTGDCEMPELTRVFERWGDQNHYFLAEGGGFESLTWSHKGDGGLVNENEPFSLAGPGHRRALRLDEGRVTSMRFCVSASMPHLRFMAKTLGKDRLDVRVDLYDDNGRVTNSSGGSISSDDHKSWAPTRFISLNTAGMGPGETATATLTITADDPWLVDAVFIDPYARR